MHGAGPPASPATLLNGDQSRKKGKSDGVMKKRSKGTPGNGARTSSKRRTSAGKAKPKKAVGKASEPRPTDSESYSVESSTADDIAAANVLNAFASAALQHAPHAVEGSGACASTSRPSTSEPVADGDSKATSSGKGVLSRSPPAHESDEEIDVDNIETQTSSVSRSSSTPLSPATSAQHVTLPVATLQPYTVALHAPPTYAAGLQGAYAVAQPQAVAFYPHQFGAPIASTGFGHPIALPQPFFAFQAQVASPQLPHTAAASHPALAINFSQTESASTQNKHDVHNSGTQQQQQSSGRHESAQGLQQLQFTPQPHLGKSSEPRGGYKPQAMKRRYNDVQDMEEQMKMINHRDADGDTCLHLAVVHGHRPMCMHLLDVMKRTKTSIDPRNNLQQTPLHLAVITDNAPLVEDLIVAGCDINLPDRNGRTPAHLCAIHHSRESLRVLGQKDIEEDTLPAKQPAPGTQRLKTEIRDYEGNAPIHLAVLHDDGRIINILLEIGADIDSKDGTAGRTALHHAVECSRLPLVRYLLDAGANVNATNYSGSSPLHTAAGREHREVVAILMSHGADATLVNSEGDTPKDLCRNKQIRQLMLK